MQQLTTIAFLLLSVTINAMPNPASVYCEQHGGKSQLDGMCLFPDNSYCEEWSYFRKTCKPGEHFRKCQVKNDKK